MASSWPLENLCIDKDSTIKALQQADAYKFLGKEESVKQLNDIASSGSTKGFFQRLWIIWQSDLTLLKKFEATKIFTKIATCGWPIDELRRVDRMLWKTPKGINTDVFLLGTEERGRGGI